MAEKAKRRKSLKKLTSNQAILFCALQAKADKENVVSNYETALSSAGKGLDDETVLKDLIALEQKGFIFPCGPKSYRLVLVIACDNIKGVKINKLREERKMPKKVELDGKLYSCFKKLQEASTASPEGLVDASVLTPFFPVNSGRPSYCITELEKAGVLEFVKKVSGPGPNGKRIYKIVEGIEVDGSDGPELRRIGRRKKRKSRKLKPERAKKFFDDLIKEKEEEIKEIEERAQREIETVKQDIKKIEAVKEMSKKD